MSNQTNHFYEFGPFRIDTTKHLLLRDGAPVPLTLKAYDTLLALVQNRYAYAVSGHKDKARAILDDLKEQMKQRYLGAFGIAIVYVGLGDKDQAFEWLQKAYEDRSPLMITLKVEPRFDGLRGDPRFADLLRRVGLPP